jgi:acyl-CoA thioester hydrolase
MTSPPSPPFRHPIRIYWEDTDAGGIVFYANYLKFFERARTEWLRARGYAQEALRTGPGLAFVVTDTSLRYRLPARLDDLIEVTVAVGRVGAASLTIAQQAWRTEPDGRGTLLCDGTIRIGCVELGTFRPVRIPTDLLESIR